MFFLRRPRAILRLLRGPLAFLLGIASFAAAHAEPLVVGFERFHQAAPSAEGGRLLYNELGCVNCHGGDTDLPARRGPELAGITRRVNAEWLRQFLADPAATRPGTVMPHVLPANEPDAADAIIHYLASLKPPAGLKTKPPVFLNGDTGRDLFHTIGCVACHEPGKGFTPPDGAPKPDEFTHRSVAFSDLAAKYSLGSLANFIAAPLKVRPDGRMPQIAMTDEEAGNIAAWLLGFTGSDGRKMPDVAPFAVDKALAQRGRALVAAANCAACHQLPKDVAAKPVALSRSEGGCLDEKPAPGVPRYELSTAQRDALKRFLAARDTAAPPAQLATLTLEALNCLACHDRDGRGGPDPARKAYFQGDHNLGDVGRYPPPLTGIGRKLEPAWFEKVLTGEFRVRPYLQTKMPVYGAATHGLVTQLASVDAKSTPALPGGDDTAGRKLLGTLGGVSCITCHRWGDRPSLGIQALDLSNLGQRIQPGWLREYLIEPAAYRTGTLMPSFWPGGKAANTEILGGDTDRQIASIYSFAKSANGEPEGFPATGGGEFELVPKERPIVQRTFMQGVGTHAILVGFPGGVSLAYDGKNARPALAWRGRFFDAYNTWFSRFAPFEKPPGTDVVSWPAGENTNAASFRGYRLDPQGNPTFLFTVGATAIQERFTASENGLERFLTWDAAAPAPPPVTHPEALVTTPDPANKPGSLHFTYSWK